MIGPVARGALRATVFVVGGALIALALLTLAARALLPLAEGYKGKLETRLGDYLGHPVVIGELDLAWRSRGPQLRLRDVSVRESAARAVSFEELRLDTNLLGGASIIDELTLVGAELAIERSKEGYRLHGLDRPAAHEEALRRGAGPDGDGEGAPRDATENDGADETAGSGGLNVLDWLLAARRVALLDTRVTFVDAANDRRLVVTALNARAENDGALHRLRVDLELPPELGGAFEIGADIRGAAERLALSDGELYLRGTELHVAALAELGLAELAAGEPSTRRGGADAADERSVTAAAMPGESGESGESGELTGPAELAEPTASWLDTARRLDADARLELWGSWRAGRPSAARARLDLRAATLGDETLLDALTADVALRNEPAGWALEADRVELAHAAERAVLENVELARDEGGWRLAAGGARLPLALAFRLPRALLAERRPPAAETLAALDPRGALVDWRARIELGETTPRVSFEGELESLSIAPTPRRPGIDALDGRIDVVDNRGSLALEGAGATLARGEHALALDTLELALELDARIPDQARLEGRLALEQATLSAEADVGLTLAVGRSPYVDVRGRHAIGDVADLPPLLALAGVRGTADRWLRRALVAGRGESGTLLWVGRLADFPHADGRGTLRAGIDVVDGELEFLPGWPRARLREGRIEIDGSSLVARSAAARLDTLEVTRAYARIDDLARPLLAFEGSGHGELGELVRFANEGPLAWLLRPVLGRASGRGRAGLDLALEVPLAAAARRAWSGGDKPLEIDGSLFLDGNELRFGRADLTFARTRGAIGFDEAGVRIGNLRATLFGRPVSIDGASEGTGENASTELELRGALEPADVLAHYGVPLDRFVRGASLWRVTLHAPHSGARLRRDGVRLLAESDLVGTRLLLPAPLAKDSARAAPFALETAFREGESVTRWRIEHDERLRAAIDVDETGMRALGIRFGEGPVAPPIAPGVRLDGRAPSLALDGWAEALATLIEDLPASPDGPSPIPVIGADLSIDALLAGTRSLGAATLRLSSDPDYLNAVLDNAHLAASVRYPREHWRRERAAKVRVHHVDRVLVDALDSAPERDGPVDALDPRELPAIDAHVSRLVWDALELRELSLEARPDPLGLTFAVDGTLEGDSTLRGEGLWRLRADATDGARADSHASGLALTLTGRDLGAGLASAGLDGVLAEGSGTVRGELAWRGPLYLPELERLDGSLSIDVARGRIVPLEPGPARLVGLFALQAIPRRLSFDFRDVTSDGLAFERLAGDVALADGVADVALVQLTGPVGVIDVDGTSNLVTREYDQRITVLPRVSAALPIIGMLSGGASAGIGALVAGGFLKALGIDLDRIGLRRYALRGSWEEPVLEPLGGPTRRAPPER